jgi:hypothetical protein
MQATGHAHIYLTNRETGESQLLDHIKNLEVYQSGDALAKMVNPQLNYAIRYVYFEFRNATPVVPVPDISDDVSIYAGLTSNYDYLRVPIIAAPGYDVKVEDEPYFAFNRATFFATTKAAPVNGSGNIIGASNGTILTDGVSKFHSAGLVASTGDPKDDLLFARLNISPGVVTKQAGYDIDIHWAIRFGPAIP